MQRVISHAKEWVCNGKNLAKNSIRFFGNGTVVGDNATIVGSNNTVVGWTDTIVGGTGDE